jgi:hypothetical protein
MNHLETKNYNNKMFFNGNCIKMNVKNMKKCQSATVSQVIKNFDHFCDYIAIIGLFIFTMGWFLPVFSS